MVTIECCYYLSQPNPILTLKKISRKIASVERGTKTFPQVEKKYVTFGKVPQHSQLSYFFHSEELSFSKAFNECYCDHKRLYEGDVL
jgi:hypothetical protein